MSSETEIRSVKGTDFANHAYVDMTGIPCSVDEQDGTPIPTDVMFRNDRTPFFYYSKSIAKMESSISENIVTYSVPGNRDILSQSYLDFTTPEIRVKREFVDEIQIRFNDYLGYSIMPSAKLITPNNSELSSINNIYCVQYVQFYSEKQASYARRAGRTPGLARWNSVLVSSKLKPFQPWMYSNRPWAGLPLYKIKQENGNGMRHVYKYDLKISNHLMMRQFIDGKWVDIPVDMSKVEGIPVGGKFEVPSMYAVFYKITDDEKERIHKDDSLYYIDTIVECDKEKDVTSGDTVSSSIDTDKMLCKVIHVGLQNATSLKFGDPFNFTTNSSDKSKGECPVRKVTLVYGKTTAFKLDISHFEGPLTDENFDSIPMDCGHIAYSFPVEASVPGANIGVYPEKMKTKISCNLKEQTKSTTKDKFTMKINVVVTRRVRIREKDGSITIKDTKEMK